MSTPAHAVKLPTQDPFTGDPLVVERLRNPASGTTIEGRFELGWLSCLTAEQLDFVGLLLARRNNVQRLAADLGIAYNSARSRLEEIGRAVAAGLPAGPAGALEQDDLRSILERVAAGELDQDEADALIAALG